jgi:coproporphyrinogen III oxidase-like Fe-S oxidoreductase
MLETLVTGVFRHEARCRMRLGPSSGAIVAPATPVCLYLHVPFCEVLCPYCTFHRVRYQDGKARRYFAALRREIRHYHDQGFRFSGAYVGGGTPTIEPGELVETLGLVRELNPGLSDISVETNPKDLRPEVLDALVGSGVRRLSVGVQTFDSGLLREMGRLEKYGDRAEILDRLAAAAGRFRTLNVDLMWNLPHQTEAMLDADLDAVLASPANQASFYPLMQSPSAARQMARTMGAPARHRLHDFYRRILGRLRPDFTATSGWCFTRSTAGVGEAGIDEYIIDSSDYVGLGSGAFGYVDGTVYATTFSLNSYVDRVERGLTGITGERRIGSRERMQYDLLVHLFGLRLERSWVRARYGRRFERALAPELLLSRLVGAVREDAGGWTLTDRGMYLWVQMMSAFFESVNAFREQMRHQIRAELEEGATAPTLGEALVPLAEIRHGPGGLRRGR